MSLLKAAQGVYRVGVFTTFVTNTLMVTDICNKKIPENLPVGMTLAAYLPCMMLGAASSVAFPVTTPLLYKWVMALHIESQLGYTGKKA